MSDTPWRVLQFAQATFGPELFALCRAVPLLDHVLCRLEELHDPVLEEDRILRNHQRDLGRQGWFDLRLPQAGAALRCTRAAMLEDKTVFFGVAGRDDLLLAGSRVGFTHPLCSVVLPHHRTVINVLGPRWNVDAEAGARGAALLADVVPGAQPAPVAVVGDGNFAHHLWNQLGALEALLSRHGRLTLRATQQPIAPLAELFDDAPGLIVIPTPPAELPRLDPAHALPFAVGGKVVSRSMRERVLRLAARRASADVRAFVAQAENPVWLSIRLNSRTPTNQLDTLVALGGALLRDGFSLVFDGFSRPNDYATNRDYARAPIERTIAQEQAVVHALLARLGTQRVFSGIGRDLLDSIHLAAHCRAYFAHHGTLQHKIGYFTTVPGLVHSNPAIMAEDRAGTHLHVIEDPGVVEYLDPSLVTDVPGKDGPMQPNNNYRFTDIPRVVATFYDFLARQGVR